MKQISKYEVSLLEKAKIIHNSRRGYVDKRGEPVGFYKTRNKRYIEDRYADLARKLS